MLLCGNSHAENFQALRRRPIAGLTRGDVGERTTHFDHDIRIAVVLLQCLDESGRGSGFHGGRIARQRRSCASANLRRGQQTNENAGVNQ